MSDANDRTLASYEAATDKYLAGTPATSPEVEAFLDRFVGELPTHSDTRVLEIGSGPGWDALALEARGVAVQRSDATKAFVDRLRAQGHEALELDVRTGELGGPWDGVIANAVLLHLEREDLERFLVRLRTAMAPGGAFGFTLKEGDGESWSEHKLDLPRHFIFWREDALRALLERTGWQVLDLWHEQHPREPWLSVLATPA